MVVYGTRFVRHRRVVEFCILAGGGGGGGGVASLVCALLGLSVVLEMFAQLTVFVFFGV